MENHLWIAGVLNDLKRYAEENQLPHLERYLLGANRVLEDDKVFTHRMPRVALSVVGSNFSNDTNLSRKTAPKALT